jgi:hypothetical protein
MIDVEAISEGKEYSLKTGVSESTPMSQYRASLLLHINLAMQQVVSS